MANGLEREFPPTAWRVTAIGPRGRMPDILRRGTERGRRSRARAIRKSARATVAALARAVVAVLAPARGPGRGVVRARAEGDCRGQLARGA